MTSAIADDAFVAGWYFGRGLTKSVDDNYRYKHWPVFARLEYERGVSEGYDFAAATRESLTIPRKSGSADTSNICVIDAPNSKR
jgi:hypothetical protein